jgi:hypothetical protein
MPVISKPLIFSSSIPIGFKGFRKPLVQSKNSFRRPIVPNKLVYNSHWGGQFFCRFLKFFPVAFEKPGIIIGTWQLSETLLRLQRRLLVKLAETSKCVHSSSLKKLF